MGSWSGCASGSAPNATCTVTGLSTFTATATANDGWTTASGGVNATGVNQTPVVTCDFSVAMPNGSNGQLTWHVNDDDGEPQHSCPITVVQPSQGTQILVDGEGCYYVDARSELCDICWGYIKMRVTDPWGAFHECTTRIYPRLPFP